MMPSGFITGKVFDTSSHTKDKYLQVGSPVNSPVLKAFNDFRNPLLKPDSLSFTSKQASKTNQNVLHCFYGDKISFKSEFKHTQKTQEKSLKISRLEKTRFNLELEEIERKSIRYFIDNRCSSGLVLDRVNPSNENHNNKMASIAATGYGMASWVLGVQKGLLRKKQAMEWCLQTLKFVDEHTPPENKGWLAHFMESDTGKIYKNSEISTVDTAIFYYCALAAGEYFGGEVKAQVQKMFNKVDFNSALKEVQLNGKTVKAFSHGFDVVQGDLKQINYTWSAYSEGIMVPLIALGSDSHKVDDSVWSEGWDRSKNYKLSGMETFERLPLFTYYYLHGFLDLKNKKDKCNDNFWKMSKNAIKMQMEYCKQNGYPDGLFGITACDGPEHYYAYKPGAPEDPDSHDGTIAPAAILACLPFQERQVYDTYQKLKSLNLTSEKYGISCAYNVKNGWKTDDALGIDIGSTLLMLDAYKSGTFHKMIQKNKIISRALKRAGFEEK